MNSNNDDECTDIYYDDQIEEEDDYSISDQFVQNALSQQNSQNVKKYNIIFITNIQQIYIQQKHSLVWKTTNDIYDIIENKVKQELEILNLSFDEVLLIYNYYQWKKDALQSQYFENEDKARFQSGLQHSNLTKYNQPFKNTFVCPVCLDKTDQSDFLICNQSICKNCWYLYIKEKTQSEQGQVFFKCPFENCSLKVPHSFILKYLKNENEIKQYKKNIGKIYCMQSTTMKCCPYPDCQYAVENAYFTQQYVKCICGNVFCFKCGKDNHAPNTCYMAQEWEKKHSSESENLKWIQLYTKLCPKCRKPIEKIKGVII
ncbi:ibr domain protein [Ichthyophthirius multifiliis]|uniref:RBR-type E3 ubiquitin transferase n=1 Tax=Ichthyophthirius multifiliis TaxID=5932 RepID=G0R4G4_ICHMU|nr:ibr domain protein [Ichthyophthirius multifiliis]EGR27639.1 ibr domain protein [Ichthyophthirius multifiliis]|eukprot:XP_004025091.1 ibr domain protein [Ichthyophthirius multifiliis]